MRQLLLVGIGSFALLAAPQNARATLHGRLPATPGGTDYQAYYDDVQDLTWVADANLAVSNDFGVGVGGTGLMTWPVAMSWIQAMNADGGTGYLGFSDWRLPGVTDVNNDGPTYTNIFQGVDYGYNIDTANGELASLWYDTLGNLAYYDTSGMALQPGWGLTNTGPFSNVQPSYHWSFVEYATIYAWVFGANLGDQSFGTKNNHFFRAWAVREGDVITPPAVGVPPGIATLLLSMSLAGLGMFSIKSR